MICSRIEATELSFLYCEKLPVGSVAAGTDVGAEASPDCASISEATKFLTPVTPLDV
jgi:hypothetical protein